jgi:hypothetical protein
MDINKAKGVIGSGRGLIESDIPETAWTTWRKQQRGPPQIRIANIPSTILKKFQRDDTLYSTLLFHVSLHVSGVTHARHQELNQTVFTASGVDGRCVSIRRQNWLIHDDGWTHTVRQPQMLWIQFNRAPDDGRGLRPKHVERLTWNNKVLYKVSSRWKFLKLIHDARNVKHKIPSTSEKLYTLN